MNGDNSILGIRWYELRVSGAGNWSIEQEGTYAPNDGLYRFMGSMAIDANGNIETTNDWTDTERAYTGDSSIPDLLGSISNSLYFYLEFLFMSSVKFLVSPMSLSCKL